MLKNDTIAAVCTGVGGAVSIIRISGPDAAAAAESLRASSRPLAETPRQLVYTHLKDGGEPVLTVLMPGPESYTGEDVAEIHCHGGLFNTRHVLNAILAHPKVRQAEPGEFTLRAFVNGKMDLTQAEAVGDLIAAQSEMARKTAERQLSGTLRDTIKKLRNTLSDLLAECESRLDFPEAVPDAVDTVTMAQQCTETVSEIRRLLDTRREGTILREGITVAIAGCPNAGKSSLLNRLLGYDRAIVTDIPGTTRDTLEEHAHIRGIPVRLTDTAGIRETPDPIEKLGVGRSEATIGTAQIVLWLLDPTRDFDAELSSMHKALANDPSLTEKLIAVWNKSDLVAADTPLPYEALRVSAKDGAGLETLFDRVEEKVWSFPHTEAPETAVNARQTEALAAALEALEPALGLLNTHGNSEDQTLELTALCLRDAVFALGRITGETAAPDVLDTIFGQFCIGK